MSKLLLNEQPLLIMPTLASRIGLNESIVLQQIHYWVKINKETNKNFKDGFYWTYNSYEEWNRQFPFWSVKTIQRAIKKLEDIGLVVAGNYNKLKIDRTKWYRIDYSVLQNIEAQPFGLFDQINRTNCPDQVDKLTVPLPEIKTKIKSETKSCLHLLSLKDDYVLYYLSVFKDYMGKEHMRVSEKNFKLVSESVKKLKDEFDLDYKIWCEGVDEHFMNLPNSNNGNILAFLKASMRYFEIDLER